MSIDIISASILLVCWIAFTATNLHSILVVHRRRISSESESYAEIERPSGATVNVAALATFVYFLESGVYIFLTFSRVAALDSIPFAVGVESLPCLSLAGLAITVMGYSIFIWSVVARGEYATSWEMRRSHRLVTWGPYGYVRHPSYLSYFLMFVGLPLIWSNLVAILPMIGLPGYYFVTIKEEELLIQRFGNEYIDYQKRTGRFLPRF